MKRVFLLLFACCLLIAPAAAAGGSGTAADPYVIQTPAELQSMQNNLAAYYVLGNDIDMSGVTSWTPIGTSSAPFRGNFNGNGYTISNLDVSATSEGFSLFGYLLSATISNVDFDTVDIDSPSTRDTSIVSILGGAIGSGTTNVNNVNVINSKIIIRNGFNVGFLMSNCGDYASLNINSCSVTNCIAIVSRDVAGCILGSMRSTGTVTISNCDVRNTILTISTYNLGGIIGGHANGYVQISNCGVYDTTLKGVGGVSGICSNSYSNSISKSVSDCVVSGCSLISDEDVFGIAGSSVASLTISNCAVRNTNIHSSTIYDIGPSGSYDSTSTATGITNVPNRYLYASGLTAAPNAATVSYTLEGQQGSTTVEATQGTAQSWAWMFGDGATSSVAEDTTHTYAAPGSYSTSLTLKNYLDSTGVTVTTSGYNILPIPPTVSASANVLQLGQLTTLSAVGTLFSTIQWQYSTDSGATWQDISGATTATYEWTPTAGAYQVRAHVTAVGTGFTADSNVLTVSVYVPPTITDVSASPTVVTAWPQQITLSATVSDNGPDATTYQWQQQVIGTTTWLDISGATTATYTASQTINSATQYRLIATGTGGQTTSDTVWIYPKSTATVSAQTGTPTTSITLSADKTYGATTIQWEYSTNGATTWLDISGATSATYSWTPQNAASYAVRAEITYGEYTLYSTYAYFVIYGPPSITAVSVSPTIGQYTETITLSAEVTDTGTTPTTYQWQQSPEGQNTWTNIQGATTAQWIGQLTFSGATDFRLIATGTGGQTISETVTYYIALPGEIQSLTATPSVITLPGSTTLTATGSNVISWEWQQYTSGVWTPIGYSASVTQRFTDAGTYQFRVLATGADGAVVTSETIEVIAGFAPSVSITSPNDGTRYQSGERIPLTAAITGTDPTWEWSFGSQDVQTGGNSQTTWVEYGIDGRYTISIRVVSLFGTDEDSITIISGRESRPIATTPPIELESDGIFEATDSLTPNENGMPDITGFIMSMSKPFTDMIGAWFYFVLFAVPYLIIWIRQKNIIIPSILGVLFAAWVLIQLPAAALPAAIALITLSVTGGLYGIYVKLQNR